MQSMRIPYFTSFGARRTKDGFGHRSTWTMWVVAALLSVLATALPLHRSVSADDPVFTTNVTNIDYETATASLTITSLPSTINSSNWIVSFNYRSPSDSHGTGLNAGPGLDKPGYDDDFVAVLNGTQITADNIPMVKLVPDSEHTIKVTLYEVHSGGSWLTRGKDSQTFNSKGGCYVHTKPDGDDPDPDNDPAHDPKGPNNLQPKWFGGSFDFSKRTETELTLDVFVTNSGLAGVNSGRCIYYEYRARGGADRGPLSAYVYTKSGGRRAWIKLTGLEMGTTYDFTVSFHPTLQDGNVGIQGTTLGARMAVRSVIVDNIEQTSARATIAVDNEGNQTHTVYYRYFKTADEADTNLHVNGNADTVKGPIVFNLSGLTATTEYKVEASLKSGFPTNQSEFDVFPTKPNKPTGLTVTPGDEQLELSWIKPAGGDAIDEYKVQWISGNETFADAETENREQTVAHVSGTTTYETIISGLDNGTLYTVQVIAKNESGEAVSDVKTGTPDVLSEKPTIQSVAEGHTQLVVTWEEPANRGSDITDYVVQWKSGIETFTDAETDNREEMVAHVSGTTTYDKIIPGLDNGTEYTVRVRAVNGLVLPDEDEDDYNWSDEETGTPRPAPTVTGVTVAKPSITRTTATATVAIDNKTGESQSVHLRHRVNTSGSSWTDATPKDTAGSSETFDLSSLTGNTEYLVEAWLASSSTVKGSVTFTTGPVEPDPPTITNIKHGDRKLTVTWTKPGDGGSSITGYKIQWTVKGQNSWTSKTVGDPNALEGSTDQVLNNGTEYTVQLIAFNSVGDSQPSNQMHDTPSTVPDEPVIQEVTEGHKHLVVTWNEPANGGDPITNYKVEYKEQSAQSWILHEEVDHNTFTETIGSLTDGTTYAVQVSAKNVNDYGDPSAERTGMPRPDPSVDSIDVDPIEQTTAVATVNIAHPTGEQKMVHLRFRINSSSEAWTTPTPQSTTTGSVEFPQFTGLKSDTEYMVEASFDSNFVNDVVSKTFSTKRPTVSSVVIDESTIDQAGATAIVRIQEPNGASQTVRLRYRPHGQSDWSFTATDAGEILFPTAGDAVSITISDLVSGTLYEVEASLESDYSQLKSTTFTTKGPSLKGITVLEVMQESAKVFVDIEAPNGRSLPVKLRYRTITNPVNNLWAYVDTSSTSATAEQLLANLTSGTEYEVQASLETSFPDEDGVTVTSDPFTTKDPSLSGLTVMDVTMTGAKVKVAIQAPNGESQTINYRYRPTSHTDWSTTATDAGSGSTSSLANSESAEITLSGLNSSTQYEIQVSLDGDLNNPTLPVLEATFTTISPNSSISDVEVSERTQTSAKVTVTVANPDTTGNAVYLHYKAATSNTWSTPSLTDDSDPNEVEFSLSGLSENTTYDVEVSLDSGFANSTTVQFTTLVTPTVSSVSVDDITKTTATATVAIANPDGTDRTVHLRYREKDATPADTWTTEMEDSSTGSQEFDLSSLTPGTTYEVEASFDSNFDTGVEDTEFTTANEPSISAVSVGSITKTTATATVSIANPDGTAKTVNLQYRVKDAESEDTWTKPTPRDTDTGSVTFDLTGLTAGTTYEVQASFDSNFDTYKDTTFTTVFEPSISAVGVGNIEKTTATATVIIANPDGTAKTVNLQYREYNQDPPADWKSTTPKDTATGSETFDLTGLMPGITYEVQASFDSNFDTYKDTTFTTKFAPTISSVRVDPDSITKTSADVIVIIANPDGSDQTVELQYRVKDPQGNWSTTQTADTTAGSATIELTGLTAGTTYEVEVALSSGFGATQTATFTTKYEPSISAVSIGSVMQTTATAAVSISNADGSTQTVHLQYREKDATPQANWMSATPVTSTTSAASIDISGLTADTAYEVEAWLANDTTKKVTATFTTLSDSSTAPSVSSVSVGDIEQTTATATVNIANPGTGQNTVNLRYSVKDEDSWTNKDKSDTGSTVTIDLSSLIAGTTYEVEAWLSTDTNKVVTATFTTSPAPSISSISVGSIARTSASAAVNIANAGTEQNSVNLRYSVQDADDWTDDTKTQSGSTVSFPLSSLTAGTTYEVEAWLGDDTDNKTTTTFTTTLPAAVPSPTINSVRVGNIMETTATATVVIDNADGSLQTAEIQYRATNPQGSWSHTFENTSTTGTATINFSGMTANTRYQVQAWLASDHTNISTASFQTQATPRGNLRPVVPTPSISAVGVGDITKTTATATVSIANPNGTMQTVYLRYIESSNNPDWANEGTKVTATSTTGTATKGLTGLTAGTIYILQASFYTAFVTGVISTTFTTDPSMLTGITVSEVMQESAKATIAIDEPHGRSLNVYVRYRKVTDPVNTDWARKDTSSTTATAVSSFTDLTSGTKYEAQASLDDSFPAGETVTSEPFTTKDPRLSGLTPMDITMTGAKIKVAIQAPNGESLTVNYRYRPASQTDWSTTATDAGSDSTTSSTESAEFTLANLNSSTQYEVQVSLDSDLDSATATVLKGTFTTLSADSSISDVAVSEIMQTTAKVTVTVSNPETNGNTVYLRHRVKDTNSWSASSAAVSDPNDAVFDLSGLRENTNYDVEMSLDSGFANSTTASFKTLITPTISSVSVDDITKTTATATVAIANPDGTQNTVNLRYSVEGEDSWTDHTKTETGSTVSFPLSSLMAGTTYEVEAWLGSDTDNKATATFTTSIAPNGAPTPSVSSVSVGSITQTTATATVNIANPGDTQNTVNLRYSVDGEDSWTDHTKTETGSTVSFPLSSLMAGTTYEVEAWLGSDTDNKATVTFTTSMTPSISSIGVGSITKTTATATVNIANPGDTQNTVNLRYSVDGEDSWTDHTKTETGSTVSFPLSSLMAGTTYEVEAWLGSDTDNKATVTFTTTQAAAVTPPSISSVNVRNVTQTSARVVVGLANANAGQRVYLQHKLSSAQWPTTSQNTTHTNGIATFNLSSLTAGTGYQIKVSLNSDMSDATTRLFTTLSPPRSPVVPTPSVSLVTFANETQTSADAMVNIVNAGTAQKTVYLRYRATGETEWNTENPENIKDTDTSKTFLLDALTAGTEYQVQAWLNRTTPAVEPTTYTFDTLPNDPSISNLKMENIGQTSATAMVEITDAGTGMKEVYLKHSIDGTDEWTQILFPTITYSDSTSIDLTGLDEQTTYQVMVGLTDGFDKAKSSTFTTLAAPSLSGVSISSITQTGAIATATIADAGTAQKTVYLRFREFGESQWSTAQTRTTTDASAAFNLIGLDSGITYEVQASLDIEFGTSKYAVFTTLSPDPSVSGVSMGSISQTSATATVTIIYPGIARKTVHLRYRVSSETEWGAIQTKATSGGSTAIDLTGLSPRTMYEVEASLGSDFAGSRTTTFSTLSPDPSVSGVSMGSITQTGAVATVTIANPGTAQKTVYLQYRVDGASEWSDSALTATTNGSSATIYMTGLIADTEYEVRASLASDFALAQHATFTTLRYPSISDVDVTDVTKTTATAEIDIADPEGSSQTVHLRHRTTTPQGEWSSTFTTASTTGDASIDLTGLTVDTEYEVEASLTSDFAVAVSDTFRTLPPDPVVAEISVNNIRQATATAYIDIANSNGSSQPVSLRYRNTTPRGNWSNIQTTTSTTDSASIDLSGLTPGTDYDVQASLDGSFPATRTKSAIFTTLRGPSIASFEAENIGRNGATVRAMIADSHGVAQTVYVRSRVSRYNAWRPTQQTDSVDDVASIRLRGLSSGTEYVADASLDSSFPDGATMSVTFTTKKREDDDDGSSSGGGNVVQAARAANVPLLGFSPQMLRFTAIEGGDNPPPQAFLVWNRAQGAMSFTLSNQQEWLSQQPTSGVSNGPDDQVTITASVDSSALASGQYVDIINIDVSSSGKSPAQVIVVLDVLPPDYIRQFVSRDEGGVVVLPDGTVKIVVQPLAPPKDVDIELMKVNLQAHGQPPGEKERVVVAIESNTYPPGGDTPEDVAYAPYVELWVQLPQEDAAACDEGKTRVYSVEAETWSLVEHRCETDESDKVWVVAQVERLGVFALVIDDALVSPTPTPVAAAVAATATAIPASAPAVAVQRISLPAQPPTPVPTSVPTAVPMPNVKTTVAPAMAPTPTPTAVPAGNEPSAPTMQTSAGDGGSGGFGRIILAALGVPMLIGTLIVVYLLYRERRLLQET